jgi:cytochrome c5
MFKVAGFLSFASVILLENTGASAQSIAENIRPVGTLCLVGQNCVGAKAESTTTEGISKASDPSQSINENRSEELQVGANINDSSIQVEADFDVASAYQTSCFACHATGAAGAPLLGDIEAWDSRMEKGMDAVMANVINGVNAMPAKGLCMNCTDNELQEIVGYMISQ